LEVVLKAHVLKVGVNKFKTLRATFEGKLRFHLSSQLSRGRNNSYSIICSYQILLLLSNKLYIAKTFVLFKLSVKKV